MKKRMFSFYSECQAYYEGLRSVNLRDKVKEERVQFSISLLEDGDLYVDLGCGSGVLANYAASSRDVYSIGVEFSHLGCKLGKELSYKLKTQTDFIVCDVESLPFKDESVDKMSSFEVLEHLIDPKLCLLEMARVCKKRGLIILSTPHYFGGSTGIWGLIGLIRFLRTYLRFRKNRSRFLLVRTEPFLNKEEWRKNPIMPDKDAVSWTYSETLTETFKKNGFKVLVYDTWAYERDVTLKRRSLTWLASARAQLKLATLKFFSVSPVIKHFGSCIFLVVEKKDS